MCGEQGLRSRSDTLAHGSSPRVRGTAVKRGPVFFPGRFIPACAGNSSRDNSSTTAPPVHPRVCGEQVLEVDDFAIPAGSSPRVRGTGSPSSAGAGEGRFIPACAGNRICGLYNLHPAPVHPRVCGEQRRRQNNAKLFYGSSPRVRGTDFKQVGEIGGRRFIPACAGNSIHDAAGVPRCTVHPRVCGDKRFPGFAGFITCTPHRFIPACAGNSAVGKTMPSYSTVHPRVCGEQILNRLERLVADGSSPRVRGTVFTTLLECHVVRFIPACAGNSHWFGMQRWCAPVHPRVCGEQGNCA